jgi:deferrochelatase/peroxidase EfeB
MPEAGAELQEGIYFRSGERAPPAYRLVVLNVVPGALARDVGGALEQVWLMLAGLRKGSVRDLGELLSPQQAEVAAQFATMQVLIGFGAGLFDSEAGPPVSAAPRPDFLVRLMGNGPAFPSWPWGDESLPNVGEGHIALQLTAERVDAVNCAAVEVCTLIADEGLPLVPVASFDGAGRADGRGWLWFHDGVSNIETSMRGVALEAPGDPAWMRGGTYMAFLRLSVDLSVWRGLPRATQELVVGRDKQTGGGLTGVRRTSGTVTPIAAPAPGVEATDAEIADYGDPPQSTDPLLEASHIHRANQTRASPDSPAALRMFRQGYDFLEHVGPDGPRVGLNFVSFQRDLSVVQHVLHMPGWLGDINFGGPQAPDEGEPDSPRFVTLEAGGFYAVPVAAPRSPAPSSAGATL